MKFSRPDESFSSKLFSLCLIFFFFGLLIVLPLWGIAQIYGKPRYIQPTAPTPYCIQSVCPTPK